MKKSVFTYSFSIIILIILVAIISALTYPILKTANSTLQQKYDTVITIIEEKTGLTITYNSLSPSILSGIRIEDITITDVENNDSIITIDSIKMRWHIFKLLSKNLEEALGKLIISGLSVNYGLDTHNTIIPKLIETFSSKTTQTKEDEPQKSLQQTISETLGLFFTVPIDIALKNTSLKYTNDSIIAELFLSKLEITTETIIENYLNAIAKGKLSLEVITEDFPLGKISTELLVKGHFTPDLENSFSQISISSLKDADFTIPSLDFHASYADNNLTVVALQNRLPFSINININTETNLTNATIVAEELDPFKVISIKNENEIIKKINGSTISGLYEVEIDLLQKTLNYAVEGNIQLSKNIIGQKAGIYYNFFGDNKKIAIEKLLIDSQLISANYIGSITLANLAIQGILDIDSIRFPTGNSLSTELYLDTMNNQLSIFAPQVFIGNKSLTALQMYAKQNNKSIDFNFEISDYSRMENGTPGRIAANGSLDLEDSAFLQVEILSEELFLASVNEILLLCLPEENTKLLSNIHNFIEPYIFSLNGFVTTDFNSVSYSLPYAIVANTQKDDEFLMLSVNGNESTIQVPTFNLLFAGQTIKADFNADLGDGQSEIFFNSSLFVNSIPYSFSGVIMPNDFITITGEYNLETTIYFLENNGLDILAKAQNFPIKYNDLLLSLNIDTQILFNSPTEWNAEIFTLALETKASNSSIKPTISLSGTINPVEANFHSISYSDKVSTLNGSLIGVWNFAEDVFTNASLNLILNDTFSNEKYDAKIAVTNPNKLSFDSSDLIDNINFSAYVTVQDSPFSRFLNFQTEENTINAQLAAFGAISNPTVNIAIKDTDMSVGSGEIDFSGSVLLEDYIVYLKNINIIQGQTTFKDISGKVSLFDITGDIEGTVEGKLAQSGDFEKKTFGSPIKLKFSPIGNNKELPLIEKSFQANLILEKLESSFFPTQNNYTINITRTPGRFDLQAGPNAQVEGYLLDNGEISIIAKEGFFIQFDGYGLTDNSNLTMYFENIYTDARYFCNLVDLAMFSLHSGIIVGNGTLSGPFNNLQINAQLEGTNIEVSVPNYVSEKLVCEKMPITITENIISSHNAYFVAQETKSGVGLNIECSLEELTFKYLDLNVKTLNNELIKAQAVFPFGSFYGLGETDLDLYLETDFVEVTGNIDTQQIEAILSLGIGSKNELVSTMNTSMGVVIDLTINVGNKSKMYLPSKTNPIIRGLVTQVEPLRIQMDSRYGTSSFTGEFEMKGGEILYLNRTFFAREAKVVMNETMEEFNPRLTARAEIRERDQSGNQVQIFLIVEDQPLLEINPKFESIPSKTEQEIMTMLGEIIIGINDNTSPLSLLGGLADYGTQLLLFRNVENAIRDTLNLDIFSFRTSFLENSLLYALDQSETKNFTAGNFLDNTSIYIGKYFDDTLYIDAMLQLLYYEDRPNIGLEGLVFKPEFGVELPSPFGTIRWSIAPEFTDNLSLMVPYTSISLKWQFNF